MDPYDVPADKLFNDEKNGSGRDTVMNLEGPSTVSGSSSSRTWEVAKKKKKRQQGPPRVSKIHVPKP